jgi:hypothetical protein
MNHKIQSIADQAVADLGREMEISPVLAHLELLQCLLQTLPGNPYTRLSYCREVISAMHGDFLQDDAKEAA